MGVRYVHAQGVAHRDLKPENLLIGKTGLKIADFGLSNIQLTSSGEVPDQMHLQTVCGTPNYVAPEVLEKEGYNGFLADVWSCGVINYVMLSGYLPFRDPNIPNLLAKILKGDYEMCPHFSAPCADVTGKMLQRDPAARATVQEIVSHPWFMVEFDGSRLGLGKTVALEDMQGAASPKA